MKILIIGFSKLKYMPYINFYLDNLDKDKNDIHILYWNRDCSFENLDKYANTTLHEFSCNQQFRGSKFSKILYFAKFRKCAAMLLKSESFDFIIVLTSLPGVLIADILKKYKGKYIFDYRDSTYENFPPFKRMIGRLVQNSVATFVSSDAFRRFLPSSCSEKIYTSHNLLVDSLSHREEKEKNGVFSSKIRIAFWGFIRHEELNKKIIERISKDKRFELHYYGREQQVALNLKAYASELIADNVFFHGEYTPDERYEFVQSTDLIHNLYFDNNTLLAMGNKFYDGIIFRIPQLCMPGSFMGEKVSEFGVGLVCDPNDEGFCEKIANYYSTIDFDSFKRNCDKLLDEIMVEYNRGVSLIKKLNG